MKLIGKRIERLNQFGDNLVIKIADEGNMRLSPALMSRLKIDKDKDEDDTPWVEAKANKRRETMDNE